MTKFAAARRIVRRTAWPCAALAAWMGLGFAPALRSDDAWQLLERARLELESSSPLQTRFTQTFLPSGFSVGDTEAGALYLDLPRCVRWEYTEPFPKSFLLCGDWAYTWNPGEPSGRRFLVEGDEGTGLELLRLEIEKLKLGYAATALSGDQSTTVVRLVPLDPENEISEARLEIAAGASARLTAVEYLDRAGSRTRFELAEYRNLEGRAVFEPPAELEWLED